MHFLPHKEQTQTQVQRPVG